MDGWLVAYIPVPRGLQQVGVVLGKARGESGLRNLRAPERQEAVAAGIGVLEHGWIPSETKTVINVILQYEQW